MTRRKKNLFLRNASRALVVSTRCFIGRPKLRSLFCIQKIINWILLTGFLSFCNRGHLLADRNLGRTAHQPHVLAKP